MTPKNYSLKEALTALESLRHAAGLPPETFPIEAVVGMISDEIDELRKLGKSDEDIADIIRNSSTIDITAKQIANNYVAPAERKRSRE
jgi:hypothetical protein